MNRTRSTARSRASAAVGEPSVASRMRLADVMAAPRVRVAEAGPQVRTKL
ncbi:hypothetical protein [Ornithinimicrobium kibberense]